MTAYVETHTTQRSCKSRAKSIKFKFVHWLAEMNGKNNKLLSEVKRKDDQERQKKNNQLSRTVFLSGDPDVIGPLCQLYTERLERGEPC